MSEESIKSEDSFEIYVAKKFQHLINLEKSPLSKNAKAKDYRGLKYPFYILMKLIAPLERKALQKEAEQNNYEEFDKKADELLTKLEIRKNIKYWIEYIGNKEVITNEKFGEIITNALNNEPFTRKYNYPINHVLFAFVAYKIHKIGLQNFCQDVKKEENQ